MSALQYHALWVTLALGAVALGSAVLTRRWGRRQVAGEQAQDALETLARYSEWLAAQRRNPAFDGDRGIARTALALLRRAQRSAFPELAPQLESLLEVHARAVDFLWRQQLLRISDTEAWLESDHDQRFMALWREHQDLVREIAGQMRAAGEPLDDPEPESVFPS